MMHCQDTILAEATSSSKKIKPVGLSENISQSVDKCGRVHKKVAKKSRGLTNVHDAH